MRASQPILHFRNGNLDPRNTLKTNTARIGLHLYFGFQNRINKSYDEIIND